MDTNNQQDDSNTPIDLNDSEAAIQHFMAEMDSEPEPQGDEEAAPEPEAKPAKEQDEGKPTEQASDDAEPAGKVPLDRFEAMRSNFTRERELREAAEADAKKAAEELEALKARANDDDDSGITVNADGTIDLDEDDYDPALVKAIRVLEKQSKEATEFIRSQREREEAEQQRQRQAAQDDQLKDFPSLAGFKSGTTARDNAMWAAAVALNNELLAADPDGTQFPDDAALFAEIERQLTGSTGGAGQQPKATTTKPALPAAERQPPSSLSNIPGGNAPPASEGDALINSSGMAGATALAKMSREQQEEAILRSMGGGG